MEFSIGWNLSNTILKENGKHPLQIQIYYEGKQYRVGVKLYLTKDEYHKVVTNVVIRDQALKALKVQMDAYKRKADDILDGMKYFKKDEFKAMFFGEINIHKPKLSKHLKDIFLEHIADYKRLGKTVASFEFALKSFQNYCGSDIKLEETNSEWIEGYRSWMVDNGRSLATADMYLRCLRRIWWLQIKKKRIHEKHYPFKDFTIPAAQRRKKALLPDDVVRFWNYIPKTKLEEKAKDYWFFCYLCNGMNPSDMLRLKGSNFKEDHIEFTRQKTKRNGNTLSIIVPLHPHAKEIVYKYAYSPTTKQLYIFPDLNGCSDETSKRKKIKSLRNYLNKRLRRIGKNMGLAENPILGISRHSFATNLLLNGHKNLAAQMLGHSNPITSEGYFASLPASVLHVVTETLLPNKNSTKTT